jgi:hypothetical protein
MKIKTGKGPKAAITPSHSLRRDRVKRWGALRSLLRLQPEPDEATHGQSGTGEAECMTSDRRVTCGSFSLLAA